LELSGLKPLKKVCKFLSNEVKRRLKINAIFLHQDSNEVVRVVSLGLFRVIGIYVLRQITGFRPTNVGREEKTYIRPANHVYRSVMCLDESLVFKDFIRKIDVMNVLDKDTTERNRAYSRSGNCFAGGTLQQKLTWSVDEPESKHQG
jgi:hypothetical protein